MCKVTRHAKTRIHERMGLPKKSCQKTADRAFENGVRHDETCGQMQKYMTALYERSRTANQIRLYGDKTYIFADDVLITVLPLPNNFVKGVKKIQGRRAAVA